MISLSFARCIAGTALAAVLAGMPIELVAAQSPTAQDLAGLTASGSYLAARHAGRMRDAAIEAAYYRTALRYDPRNSELLDRTFLSLLVGGDIDEAVKYAERVGAADKNDRVSRLVLGVSALKRKQYAAARTNLTQSIRGPITDLTATLLSAWAMTGANDSKGAVAAIDKLQGPDWYAIFKDLHAGMIYDLATTRLRPANVSSAPTSSTPPRCAWSRLTAAGCRATVRRRKRLRCSRLSTEFCRAIRWWSRP